MWNSFYKDFTRIVFSKHPMLQKSQNIHTGQKIKRVVIGMSGGVDSTVGAHMLKSKGFEVIGVFMKNWDIADETGTCRADKEAEDAEYACQQLNIPFQTVNFVKQYWNEVFEKLVNEYEQGWTPNPDVDCNRHIKFGTFYQHCREYIGCDAIATGHYARSSFGDFLEDQDISKNVKLLKAMDSVKDQTFFLSQIPQNALRSTMFPIGSLTKDVVKKIAKSTKGLEKIAKKKESMGICFVGKRRDGFQEFLKEYTETAIGPIIDIETYKTIGEHEGVHLWTIGQDARLAGQKGLPYFVCDKDKTTNTVYVCKGSNHPALYCENFHTDEPYWIDHAPEELSNRSQDQTLNCQYRSQNQQPVSDVCISYGLSSTGNWEFVNRKSLIVSLVEPERAITPGQYAVFYKGEECLGSARINKVGPSLYTMNKDNCREKLKS